MMSKSDGFGFILSSAGMMTDFGDGFMADFTLFQPLIGIRPVIFDTTKTSCNQWVR